MKKGEPYRPSNGTEGDYFMHEYCFQCVHENPNTDLEPNCELLTASMCYGTNDQGYPKEWVYNEHGKPTCTKFKKWDWDNDGDPNDPDNPKNILPPDPNQLCLPFEMNEILADRATETHLETANA